MGGNKRNIGDMKSNIQPVKVKYLSEFGADTSQYQHKREECFEFEVPYDFLYEQKLNQRIRIVENGLDIEYKFKYIRCG